MTPKYYPVMDKLSYAERKKFGVNGVFLPSLGAPIKGIMAKKTGEYRKPKRGEWYLSGAIVEAYKAPNDLGDSYYIAELVKVKTVTKIVEI